MLQKQYLDFRDLTPGQARIQNFFPGGGGDPNLRPLNSISTPPPSNREGGSFEVN